MDVRVEDRDLPCALGKGLPVRGSVYDEWHRHQGGGYSDPPLAPIKSRVAHPRLEKSKSSCGERYEPGRSVRVQAKPEQRPSHREANEALSLPLSPGPPQPHGERDNQGHTHCAQADAAQVDRPGRDGDQPGAPQSHTLVEQRPRHQVRRRYCERAQHRSRDADRHRGPPERRYGQGHRVQKQRLAAVVGLEKQRALPPDDAERIQRVDGLVVIQTWRQGAQPVQAQNCAQEHRSRQNSPRHRGPAPPEGLCPLAMLAHGADYSTSRTDVKNRGVAEYAPSPCFFDSTHLSR